MRSRVLAGAIVVGAVLGLASTARAQDTGVLGTVTDATDAVLPGVTITALHVESGNTFVGVTDATGQFRISAMRPGGYTVTAELPGFVAAARQDVEVRLGQRVGIDFTLRLSTVQESVTVTAESPLIDTTQSSLGSNINPLQVEELPVNGRNWMDLTMLAKGSRVNSISGDFPAAVSGGLGMGFQLNLDGQQVTTMFINTDTVNQAQLSRDAIGEFEVIANRFDATQGRSLGLLVNAITKSGTNTFSGTVSGYFRSDKFNAADFITKQVLPYSNQQVSATFGGPIKKNKVHFFGNFEFEREPKTFTLTSPYPAFNLPGGLSATNTTRKEAVKVDVQLSSTSRLMGRHSSSDLKIPYQSHVGNNEYGSTVHPASGGHNHSWSRQTLGTLTQVLGQKLNELKFGYAQFERATGPHPQSDNLKLYDLTTPRVPGAPATGSPRIMLRGYTIGASADWPQNLFQGVFQLRDDFAFGFNAAGRHQWKVGGELLRFNTIIVAWNSNVRGTLDATGGPVPANIESLFPVWNDPATWNLAALSPITVRWTQNVSERGGALRFPHRKNVYAVWLQDDWKLGDSLTLNLGLRWDASPEALLESYTFDPFLAEERSTVWTHFQPRFGFVYALPDDRTVFRGGAGKYYPEITDQPNWGTRGATEYAGAFVQNDGRPDFASNPFNGPPPTYAQVRALVPKSLSGTIISPQFEYPYSWQASLGVQRQLGQTMAFEADYVYTGTRRDGAARNANLVYNPVTGANYAFNDPRVAFAKPYPEWTSASMLISDNYSNYHGLETGFTKRFSDRWQASATYTLGFLKNAQGVPTPDDAGVGMIVPCVVPGSQVVTPCPADMKWALDMGGDYTYGAGDQRHRAVFNGIWELPAGFQLSGLYFFGSGQRLSTTVGADRRLSVTGTRRLRANGTLVPRSNLVGTPLHRVDFRVQRTFPLGRVKIDGIFEMFNAFNHANYGSFVANEESPLYGRPQQNIQPAYYPRSLQLGFRVAF